MTIPPSDEALRAYRVTVQSVVFAANAQDAIERLSAGTVEAVTVRPDTRPEARFSVGGHWTGRS